MVFLHGNNNGPSPEGSLQELKTNKVSKIKHQLGKLKITLIIKRNY